MDARTVLDPAFVPAHVALARAKEAASEPVEKADTAKDWVLRAYDPELDEDAMHHLLGVAYMRSRAGQRAGVQEPRRREQPDDELTRKRAVFVFAHRPIWEYLLETATVLLAVDPDEPRVIYGWCLTGAPNVVHAVGCKRSVVDAGVALDMVKELIGDRLGSHQVCTLELPQMRTRGTSSVGLDRPRDWSMDPTWLVTRMVGR